MKVKVSTRGDYATQALLCLALHAADAPITVRDISQKTDLPQPYLEQIMLALKGAGIVKSKRGANGGYILAKPPEEVSLATIISAVEGPIVLGDFSDPHTDGACDHQGYCVLLAIWKKIGTEIQTQLAAWTLADIASISTGETPWPENLRD